MVIRFWSCFKPDSIRQASNTSIHWRFQDAVMSSALDSVGRAVSGAVSGLYLGGGYCRGCPGRKCAVTDQHASCRNPGRRTYSMEGTGIDVVSTVERTLQMQIHWYSAHRDVPYLAKVGAVFSGESCPWPLVVEKALEASPFFAGLR
jgi:hypothetical protein